MAEAKLEAAVARYREKEPGAGPGLAAFLAWAGVEEVSGLEAEMLVGFVEHMKDRGLGLRTVLTYRSVANRFFRWLHGQGALGFLERELWEALDRQAQVTPSLSLEKLVGPAEAEVRALVRAARAAVPAVTPDMASARYRELAYLRNVTLVETLRVTGARLGEVVALRRGIWTTSARRRWRWMGGRCISTWRAGQR